MIETILHSLVAALLLICGSIVALWIAHPTLTPLLAIAALVLSWLSWHRGYLLRLARVMAGRAHRQPSMQQPRLWILPPLPSLVFVAMIMLQVLAMRPGILVVQLLVPVFVVLNLAMLACMLIAWPLLLPMLIQHEHQPKAGPNAEAGPGSPGPAPLTTPLIRLRQLIRTNTGEILRQRMTQLALGLGYVVVTMLVSALVLLPASGSYLSRIVALVLLGEDAAFTVAAQPVAAVLVTVSAVALLGLWVALWQVHKAEQLARLYKGIAGTAVTAGPAGPERQGG